jgi:hypothetical protein
VSLCEGRQRRIIADVWPALADSGLLIYSTCTFNRFENDGNVRWIAENLGGTPVFDRPQSPYAGVIATGYGFSLVPGFVKGEGQYCSAVRKTDDSCHIQEFRQTRSRNAKDKGIQIPASLKDLFTVEVSFRQ